MKGLVAVFAGALAMCASLAMAAVPAAPVFNTAVKVADGKIRGQNSKVVVDGTTIYAAFEDFHGANDNPVMVAKSTNGVTWGLPIMPDSTATGVGRMPRVAVSNDPVYTGMKIIHSVWQQSTTGDIMYSFFSNRPNQTGWSAPVKINGSAIINADEINLITTANGEVHVLMDNYYSTASAPDSIFIEPIAVVASGSGSLAKDANNNLYAAFQDGTFSKKAAGSSNWVNSTATFAPAGTVFSERIQLAIADANTYYVAYGDTASSTVKLASSTNGGTSWISRTAIAYTTGGSQPSIAVTSAKVLTLVTMTAQNANGTNTSKVVRTNDNGVTWSTPVTIQGDDSEPSISLDASNKVMIFNRDDQNGKDWASIRNNPNASLIFIKEK
ncbi:MAG: exo-alpha-sialidase [Geobacteraceae bacterium]|nr:exo-alpha-sialidase [Geobacteraceae bacterium]